jgi:lipopolysaccharide export system permease protein
MTALTSLMLLQYIAKRFGELVGKGLPWRAIVEFLALSIPLTVALTMPMAVLVATLYAFSRLAAENEFTALKATGVGPSSVMKPVILAAAGVTLVMVLFNDQVLSAANHRLRVLQSYIAQKKPTFGLREQVINEVSPGKLYLRAGHLDQKRSNKMRDVTIYDMSDPTRRRTIYADSGDMAMSRGQRDLELTLYKGTMEDVPVSTPTQLQRLFFDVDLVRIRGVGNEFQQSTNDQYKSEREMSVCEMRAAAEKARGGYTLARKEYDVILKRAKKAGEKLSKASLQAPPGTPTDWGLVGLYCKLIHSIGPKAAQAQGVPIRQGPDARGNRLPVTQAPSQGSVPMTPVESAAVMHARFNAIGKSTALPTLAATTPSQAMIDAARARMEETRITMNTYYVEIHKKFALAVACFVFVLLGAPIAIRFPRGGVGLTIGVSLLVFASYYICLIAGEALAKRGMIPASISMWIANLIFGTVGIILVAKMGTEPATARGGEMGEHWTEFKRRVRRARRRMRTSGRMAMRRTV